MGQELLVLSIALFGASVLQSATGIAFGVVAGTLLESLSVNTVVLLFATLA